MGMTRYPLAQAFMSRDGQLGAKDAFVQNGYIDKYQDKTYVCKRPGTTTFFNLGVGGSVQGATYYNGLVYEVINDTFYRTIGTTNNGSTLSKFTPSATPKWYQRTENQALVFNNRLWIIGAGVQPNRTATGEVWSTQDGITWALATSGVGAARLRHRCCVFNGAMWMMGGSDLSGNLLNDVLTSIDGVTWTQVVGSAGWSPRRSFGLISANNGMYVFGGADGTFTNKNDVWFSSDGANWEQISSGAAWTARNNFGHAYYNNQFVIAGGAAGATAFNDCWSSSDGIAWTQQTGGAFNFGRSGNQLVVYGQKLFCIGGITATTAQLADVYSTTNLSNWIFVTASPGFSPRTTPCVAVFQTPTTVSSFRYETVWVMAGGPGGLELNDVWFGNLDTQIQLSYSLSPSVAFQSYQFSTFLDGSQLLMKNQSNFWVLAAGTLNPVIDPNYPPVTVPGLVVLNSFAYICTPGGELHACALENARNWPSLQFTHADYEDDPAVCIAKYLNYVVVFGTYTMQFFYDAGNPPPGIPLSPYIGANLRVGCAFAQTVQNASNTMVWVGQTKERGWGVYVIDGMTPVKVSTTWVDKALNVNLNSGVTSWVQNIDGHTFYVLNLLNYALVYDLAEKQWYVWNSPLGRLPYAYALSTLFSGGDLLVGSSLYAGILFSVSTQAYDDAGLPFTLMVQTDKLDAGTLKRKFWGSIEVVADQAPATAYLSWSDNDYQSFNLPVPLDLSLRLPRRNRMGSSRRRAFRLAQTDSNPARWESLEINVDGSE